MATKTIAYCKHGLGNIVMMTPALRALASMDPAHKIDICLDSEWQDRRKGELRDFFGRWDLVEDVIEYPQQQFTKNYKAWFFTRHAEYSQAFDVFASRGKGQSNLMAWNTNQMHEIDFYMDHVRRLGYRGATPAQWVPATCERQSWVDVPNPLPRVGLCNGGFGGLRKCKAWPHFAELAKVLQYHLDAKIEKFGWKTELEDVNTYNADHTDGATFVGTCERMAALDLFITTDTALMHVADALRLPVVAIFGGSLASKNAPVNGTGSILRTTRNCSPCQTIANWAVCETGKCLEEITVSQVVAHVKTRLSHILRPAA